MFPAKSKRASERLQERSTKYLEEKLRLTVNREKSRTVSVFAIRNFKFLGFALGRNGSGIYVRVHEKSWKKFKTKLKDLSSRRSVQSIKPSLEKIKVYARGWLNYYGIASMKNNIEDINGWLYHRMRMCIWKQWKKPKTKVRNRIKMGVPEDLAWQAGNSRRGYWFTTHTAAVNMAMTKERRINSGFYDLATASYSIRAPYQRLGKSGIEAMLREVGERTRIHAYPHRYRGSFITDACVRGFGLDEVQDYVGHSDPKTTNIYRNKKETVVRAKFDRLIA